MARTRSWEFTIGAPSSISEHSIEGTGSVSWDSLSTRANGGVEGRITSLSVGSWYMNPDIETEEEEFSFDTEEEARGFLEQRRLERETTEEVDLTNQDFWTLGLSPERHIVTRTTYRAVSTFISLDDQDPADIPDDPLVRAAGISFSIRGRGIASWNIRSISVSVSASNGESFGIDNYTESPTGFVRSTRRSDFFGARNFRRAISGVSSFTVGVTITDDGFPDAPPVTNPAFAADSINIGATVGDIVNASLPSVSGGKTPYTYTASGFGASGLSVTSDGRVTGTAGPAGTYTATVTVTDADNKTDTCTVNITIAEVKGDALRFTSGIADFRVESGSSIGPLDLPAATGGTGPYKYALALGGTRAAGGSLSLSNRTLSGRVPRVATETRYSLVYSVTDANNDTAEIRFIIVVTTAASYPPVFTQRSISTTGVVGTDLAIALPTATADSRGGAISYAFTGAPPGMSVQSGSLTGAPTLAGTWSGTWTATNDDGSDFVSVVVVVANPPDEVDPTDPDPPPTNDPKLPSVSPINGLVSTPFSETLPAATGGVEPYKYSLSTTAPGVAFDPSTRILAGTIHEADQWPATYVVTDKNGNSDSAGFVITIRQRPGSGGVTPDPGDPTFSDVNIPSVPDIYGRIGQALNVKLPEATGGSAPYTYAVEGLPAGLEFVSSMRVVRGTPQTSGTGSFAYTATDVNRQQRTVRVNYSIASETGSPPIIRTLTLPPTTRIGGLKTGAAFDRLLPAATNATGKVTYDLSAAPQWLKFDPETRRITGTPPEAGEFGARYTAEDEDDNTAISHVIMIVSATGVAPDIAPKSFPPWPPGNVALQERFAAGGRRLYGVFARLDITRGDAVEIVTDTIYRTQQSPPLPVAPPGNDFPPDGWLTDSNIDPPNAEGEVQWAITVRYAEGSDRPNWNTADIYQFSQYVRPPNPGPPDPDPDPTPDPPVGDPEPPPPPPPASLNAYYRADRSVSRPSSPVGPTGGAGWLVSESIVLADRDHPRVFWSGSDDNGKTWTTPERYDTWHDGSVFYDLTSRDRAPAVPQGVDRNSPSGAAAIPAPAGASSSFPCPNQVTKYVWQTSATGTAKRHTFTRWTKVAVWTRVPFYAIGSRAPVAPSTWRPSAGWSGSKQAIPPGQNRYVTYRSGIDNPNCPFMWSKVEVDETSAPVRTATRNAYKVTVDGNSPPPFPGTSNFRSGDLGWYEDPNEARPSIGLPYLWHIQAEKIGGVWQAWVLVPAPGQGRNHPGYAAIWQQDYVWQVVDIGDPEPAAPASNQLESHNYPGAPRSPRKGIWYAPPSRGTINADLYHARRNRVWPAQWPAWNVALVDAGEPINPGGTRPIEV